MAMDETTRKVLPLIDLTDWDKPLELHQSLAGQQNFFDEHGEEARSDPILVSFPCGDSFELFETGRDLPGAKETDQSIFWDVT